MAWLAQQVNAGSYNGFSGRTITLGVDINLQDNAWTPIGNGTNSSFAGTFDGDGHTIKNLTVTEHGEYSGLFGYVGSSGTVKNVTLEDVKIEGYSRSGALVGQNNGDNVTNCTVKGTITVSGLQEVGGLVGRNNGTIENCMVSGDNVTVTGTSGDVGGLVGYNAGNSTIIGCKAVSTVTGTAETPSGLGSFVGYNGGTVGTAENPNYYYKDDSSTLEPIGTDSGTGNNVQLYKLTLPNVGSDGVDSVEVTFNDKTFEPVIDDQENNDDYYVPSGATVTLTATTGYKLNSTDATITDNKLTVTKNTTVTAEAADWEGAGTESNPYQITSAADLQKLAEKVNGGNNYSGKYFKLTDNIDLSSVSNWTPIGNGSNQFNGTFDGDNKTISNLTISGSSSYVGLFGYNAGTIQNVTLTDATVSGGQYVGALVGRNDGTVDGCTVSLGTNGTVTGTGNDVGGLVGFNSGTVTNGTVNVGTISGNYNVGGLVGNSQYSTSSVTGGTVTDATITGTGSVGGIVGFNSTGGTVSGNTAIVPEIKISGSRYVGGLVGDNRGTVGTTENPNKFYSNYAAVNNAASDNTRYYKLTLPTDGVEVTGGTTWTVGDTTYYAGTVTLSG